MRERMDIIESERKQWGDIIQKLKKERLQAAMTTRKKLEEVASYYYSNKTLLR